MLRTDLVISGLSQNLMNFTPDSTQGEAVTEPNRESEFGVFKMGKWLRTAYFPTSVFSIILVIPTTFRSQKELTNFSTRVSNPPFQYGVRTVKFAIEGHKYTQCIHRKLYMFTRTVHQTDGPSPFI